MVSNDLRKRFRFFHEHGGQLVGHQAASAIEMARNEAELETLVDDGVLVVEWEADDDPDGPEEWGWSENDIKRWERTDHEVEACIIRTAEGTVLASLSGIWDADRNYRRVVEAELAGEALDAFHAMETKAAMKACFV